MFVCSFLCFVLFCVLREGHNIKFGGWGWDEDLGGIKRGNNMIKIYNMKK